MKLPIRTLAVVSAVAALVAVAGAQVLRTDRLGSIVVRTDGHRLFVKAGEDQWELPLSPTR